MVKSLEQHWHVLFRDTDSKVLDGFDEFRKGKRLSAIVVHDCEESLQSDHASGAPGFELVSEEVQKLLRSLSSCVLIDSSLSILLDDVRVLGITTHLKFILEEPCAELLVIKVPRAIFIHGLEDVVEHLLLDIDA